MYSKTKLCSSYKKLLYNRLDSFVNLLMNFCEKYKNIFYKNLNIHAIDHQHVLIAFLSVTVNKTNNRMGFNSTNFKFTKSMLKFKCHHIY